MSISDQIQRLHDSIENAASAARRPPSDVNLLAVSKKQPRERIIKALEAGQRFFGENRVQEAQERWGTHDDPASWRALYPDLKLHLIGPLQTNKAAQAVALFDVLQTLDRKKLARILAQEMEKQGRQLPCFIQVNTGEESQKAGIAPQELDDFYAYCVEECGLNITGLMCIPPSEDPPALHFALLRDLAHGLGLPHLSMGMSGDFEKAIALGATFVRVGTGVFGERTF